MKKIIMSLVMVIVMFSSHGFADPGDRIDPTNNALWQLAAVGFVQKTLATANNLSSDWRAWETITIMQWWLLIEAGQPVAQGGTGKIYEKGIYSRFLGKFQYFSYGDSAEVELNPTYASPENAFVDTTTISCDNPTGGDIRLYKLVGLKYFVEQDVDGVINGTRLEFSGLSKGKYVLGFADDLNRLSTEFLTVL